MTDPGGLVGGKDALGGEPVPQVPADMLPTVAMEAWKPPTPDEILKDPGPSAQEGQPDGADLEFATLPRAGGLFGAPAVKHAAQQLAALFSNRAAFVRGRPRWFLPTVAAAGLAVGIGLVAVAGSFGRKDPSRSPAENPAAPLGAAASADLKPSATASPPAGVTLGPCVATGAPRTLAPGALVSVGLEVRTLGTDAIGLGFASTEHDAVGLRIEPDRPSSAPVTAKVKSTVRHVSPLLKAKGQLAVATDVERKNDAVRSRRTVLLDPPLQVGATSDGIVWSRPDGPAAGTIWRLEGDGDVDALRAVVAHNEGEPTTAIAFRRGNAIYVGTASGGDALTPASELFRFDGWGQAVGSPAVAVGEDAVMAAWADRTSLEEPWRLRWVRFRLRDSAAPTPATFVPPDGGRGQQAMSPALTALPGRRFLFLWTEGPPSAHDLRAITISDQGESLGGPLTLSAPGSNAGQGQAAVTGTGEGFAVFLESIESGFRVVASPISCPMPGSP